MFPINNNPAFSFILSAFSFSSGPINSFRVWLGKAQNYLFNKICFILFISDIEHTNQFEIQGI